MATESHSEKETEDTIYRGGVPLCNSVPSVLRDFAVVSLRTLPTLRFKLFSTRRELKAVNGLRPERNCLLSHNFSTAIASASIPISSALADNLFTKHDARLRFRAEPQNAGGHRSRRG